MAQIYRSLMDKTGDRACGYYENGRIYRSLMDKMGDRACGYYDGSDDGAAAAALVLDLV